ncbi:MAG: phosphoribosylglycinamide formyltransferase [Chloroflexi bacterium]|nr:phosphoribosylglycinamide formyltransferase [Chloroflexota bacterium]
MRRARVGVLISGRGSNLRALLDATERGDVPADVVLVASNRADAQGLVHARERAVPVVTADRQRFGNRAARQDRIRAALDAAGVDLVVLAGWDEILAPSFIAAFAGRILNVHPSLLPAFGKTLHAQAEALEHGVKVSGCTVHFVTDDVDCGPIVLQRAVPVEEDDTVETLATRILAEEHHALPEAVGLWCAGRLHLDGQRVRILPAD